MKILIAVKQVPDTSGKVAVNPDGTLNRASMQTIINPDDKNAVEAALIQFVEPALINQALNTLNYRTRKKLKDEAFQSLDVSQDTFSKLLQVYFNLYGLPMEFRRDYEKQFAPENLELTFCEESVI